jgi:hypothetical protein
VNDVKKLVENFLKTRKPNNRDSSFDYCYNYFYSFRKDNKIDEISNKKNIQTSCLQLGFYLASWGMMRGSSFLLKKSSKYYENLIKKISEMDKKLWEIDVDNYNEENIEKLLSCKKQIIDALGRENRPTDTLVSKIMLGVFSNIPAFDENVKKVLRSNSLNKKSLEKIKNFYEKNKKSFDSIKIHTLSFSTGKKTNIIYKKAKLIDMYLFMKGKEIHQKT